jgi:regulator of protease activity HflC (stomatin/prohibitin superfamily)
MFDKLVELLIDCLDLFRFWEVIDPYEQGVRIRFGKSNRKILTEGLHWQLPFKFDKILTINHVPSVKELGVQTITTADGVTVGLQAIVKYEIKNPAVALLDVDNEVDAVAELTQAIIRSVIIATPYASVNNLDLEDEIIKLAKKEATQWGIKVVKVTIKSLGKIPTIRLMQ